MKEQINTGKFTVAASIGGSFSTTCGDRSPVPDFTCGHIHRTEAAADKCRETLLAFNRKTGECSAKWYNSRVFMCGCETESGYC